MAAQLTLDVFTPSGSYDVAAFGTLDWLVYPGNANVVRKNATNYITIAKLATGSAFTDTGYTGAASLTWSGGAPTASGSTTGGVYTGSSAILTSGTGWEISIPADTSPRTVRIFCGTYSCSLSLSATLSDGSAPAKTFVSAVPAANTGFVNYVDLTFAAGSAGQTLKVQVKIGSGANNSNVSLQAVALQGTAPAGGGLGAPQAPTVSATPGVDSATITITPGTTGGAPITGYGAKIYAADDNSLLGSATGTSSPLTVGGLPKRVSYAKGTVTNSAGYTSSESAASATFTPISSQPDPVPVRFDFPASYEILSSAVEPVSDIISVSVTPNDVTVQGGVIQQFVADVRVTNGANPAVQWSGSGGLVGLTGEFVATVSDKDQIIFVRATSVQDPRKWGEARVFVPAKVVVVPQVSSVEITPAAVTVAGRGTVQFTAKVNGPNNPSQAGTWETTLGSITAQGFVMAPAAAFMDQIGTAKFTSDLDPTQSGTALFVVEAVKTVQDFIPSAARTVRILPGRLAYAVGSHWSLSTAGPVGSKDPNAVIDVPFDWSAWLADIGRVSLSKVEFLLGGGLVKEGVVAANDGGTVLVSGGTPGTAGTITCRITTATNPSRTEDRTVVLQIQEQ